MTVVARIGDRRLVDELRPGHFALYREAVLLALHTGEWQPFPDDEDVNLALWRLRADSLVGWEAGHPTRELTPAGRALAERLLCR